MMRRKLAPPLCLAVTPFIINLEFREESEQAMHATRPIFN